jgi:glycerol-3-phosphate acyltransferase PlsY
VIPEWSAHVVPLAACAGIGFLCGALPFGLWLGRAFRHVDVRMLGSGNLGATNVYRSLGPALGFATLALDVAKGAVPVLALPTLLGVARPAALGEWARLLAGLFAVAGHVWTPFAGFRGGKGVATTAGVLAALAPVACAVFALVFVAVVAITRFISLGSVLGSLAFVVALARWPRGTGAPTLAAGIVLALIIVLRHRDNLVRLARGEERRFSLRRGGGGPS